MRKTPEDANLKDVSDYLNASRVLFVLGAGASVPLGMPTTKALRKTLCDGTTEGRVAAELHQSAAYRFRVSEDDINIEDFLEHLYELQLLLWLAQRSSLPQLLPNLTANTPALSSANETLHRVQRRAFQLLHDTCGDCSGKKVDALWRPILDYLSSHQPVVPIFTLNYDWSFEKLAIEEMNQYQLIDGFELLGGKWDANRFSNTELAPHKTHVALHKLHGSTNWLPGGPVKSTGRFPQEFESDDQLPPYQFEMVYPGHAQEAWFGKESWQQLNDPRGMFEPWNEREPYKTLHANFHRVARRANLIVVIGYAFHDDRVNVELVEAVNANDRTRVLVVDPGITQYVKASGKTHQLSPFHFLTFDRFKSDWSRFDWLRGKFGDKRITTKLIDAICSAVS